MCGMDFPRLWEELSTSQSLGLLVSLNDIQHMSVHSKTYVFLKARGPSAVVIRERGAVSDQCLSFRAETW